MGKSTSGGRNRQPPSKPAKPHKDFPLFPHATKRWAKKIRGKLYYFGPWSDPQAALQRWLDQHDDLLAGRTPRAPVSGFIVRHLLNHFLTSRQRLVESGELTARSFGDYKRTCEGIAKGLGLDRLVTDLAADDFERFRAELARTRGPVTLGNEIQRVRVVFNYAYNQGLVPQPIRYGGGFKKPSAKTMRLARAARGDRLFSPEEIRQLLAAAGVQLRAMVLLALNAAFGNADCGRLPIKALDREGGWVSFPRPKTGVARRFPLWPETMEALRQVLAARRPAQDVEDDGLVFLTSRGRPWAKETKDNPIAAEFHKLLARAGVPNGRGFCCLRHVFRTVADESMDQPAIDHIMGHARDDMASHYRERIADDRLRRVVDHVRMWLFGQPAREPVVAEPAAIAFDARPLLLAGVVADLRKEGETQ